jgi:DNA primase
LLSNWYNGSLDDALAGKRVILALDGDVAGFTGAVRIAHQLRRVTQDIKVLGLPDGLDPTDIALPELKEMLK